MALLYIPYGEIFNEVEEMTEKTVAVGLRTSFVPRGLDEPDEKHKVNPFAYLLGFKRTDTLYVIQKISEGLSYKAYLRLLRETALSQKILCEIVRIPASTLARRQESGNLTPAESDRLARIAKVFVGAVELFEGDKSAARKWLSAPSKVLGGETPLKYSQSELGAREVEKLIGRLEHGVFS